MHGPSLDALKAARDEIERRFLGKGGNVHTVYIGEKTVGGEGTGEPAVVVSVDSKLPVAQIAKAERLPSEIVVAGQKVPVDIVQADQPRITRLLLSDATAFAQGPIGDWQKCHDCPIPGGVQIAPEHAGWVGTLSCAVEYESPDGGRKFGALTNYHVAVSKEQRGIRMGQPSGSGGDWFAKLDNWAPISFSQGASNRVDGAVLDTWRDDGKYAPGTHTVKPEQFNLGAITPEPVLVAGQKVGDRVHKSGRTTGYRAGRVIGIGATSHVGYDGGTARFVDQLVIQGDGGDMSQPGDSGSLILTESGNRPYALLFAGGGGQTIANPIQFVIEAFGLRFFGP